MATKATKASTAATDESAEAAGTATKRAASKTTAASKSAPAKAGAAKTTAAKAGAKGKAATTHHDFHDDFARSFPDVQLKRGVRFVEHERVATAAGLSAGIDLALRVVERYFGRGVAQRTAEYMEYESRGWIV